MPFIYFFSSHVNIVESVGHYYAIFLINPGLLHDNDPLIVHSVLTGNIKHPPS